MLPARFISLPYEKGDILKVRKFGYSHYMVAAESGRFFVVSADMGGTLMEEEETPVCYINGQPDSEINFMEIVIPENSIKVFHVTAGSGDLGECKTDAQQAAAMDNAFYLREFGDAKRNCIVKFDIVKVVVPQYDISVDNMLDDTNKPADKDIIIRRAIEWAEKSFTGTGSWDYNVLFHNCEHFATWCRYGREFSGQTPISFTTTDSTIEYRTVKVPIGSHSELNGPSASIGIADGNMKGLKAEITALKLENEHVEGKLGLAATTGIENEGGNVGVQLLGTGFSVGEKGFSLSVFGSSIGIKKFWG